MVDRRSTWQPLHGASLRDQRRLLRGPVGGRYLGPAADSGRHREVASALRAENAQIGTTGERSDSAVNLIPDKFAQWDAAYVLGALSPAERREFEEHMSSCAACQAAISELAALPGLLAQISPADAAMLSLAADRSGEYTARRAPSAAQAEVIEDGPPPSLLPAMIKTVRMRRRRMVAAVAGIAAAVVLVVGGLAVGAGLPPLRPDPPQRVAFSPVMPSAITAV